MLMQFELMLVIHFVHFQNLTSTLRTIQGPCRPLLIDHQPFIMSSLRLLNVQLMHQTYCLYLSIAVGFHN